MSSEVKRYEIRNAAFAACPDTGCDWSSFYRGWLAAREEYDYAALEAECERLRLKVMVWNDGKPYAALKAERDALAAELENLTAKHKVARAQIETSLRANEQLRAELAAIKGQSGFDYSIRTQSTNRIPVPSQEIHFNSPDQLPPVDTPLLVMVDGEAVRARRPNFVERKGADLEFILVDGRTISGRLPWTYP